MKNTIFNFKQSELLKLKKQNEENKIIKIDATDLLILDWFIYFTPEMNNININGKVYYWLSYSKLQEDLPFLDMSKRSFADRLKKMCEFDILSFYLNKEQGNTTFYSFGNNYFNLIKNNDNAENYDLCGQNNKGYVVETTESMQLKQQTYSSINNNSISNSSDNIYNINNNSSKKKKEKVEIENLEERLQAIYDYWNTKEIIKHHTGLTKELKEAYTKAIIKWELNDDTIKEAIDNYDTMLKDYKSGFTYKWNLADFLSRENGARTFTSESSRWNNYQYNKNKTFTVKQNNGLVNYEIDPTAPYRNRGDNNF